MPDSQSTLHPAPSVSLQCVRLPSHTAVRSESRPHLNIPCPPSKSERPHKTESRSPPPTPQPYMFQFYSLRLRWLRCGPRPPQSQQSSPAASSPQPCCRKSPWWECHPSSTPTPSAAILAETAASHLHKRESFSPLPPPRESLPARFRILQSPALPHCNASALRLRSASASPHAAPSPG